MLDISRAHCYNSSCSQALRKKNMERWLSWSKAHDWKSCVPYKGTEGSNPSLSAKKESSLLWRLFFLYEMGRDSIGTF